MKVLNMTGKPCPIPVVEARKALEENPEVTVRVDNVVAVQNLEKMAKGKGLSFTYTPQEKGIYAVVLTATLAEGNTASEAVSAEKLPATMPAEPSQGATLLITKSYLGEGAEELGKILMKGFLFTLTEWDTPPQTVLFLNSGVQLVCEGSNALEDLRTLAERGTSICACGTCLNYFGLTEKLAIGQVVDMMAISGALAGAGRLITI